MTGALIERAKREMSGLDGSAMELAEKRWDSVAKPLKSLGLLEEAIIKIAGMTGNAEASHIGKKAVAIFCGDNVIVEEGVTQTGQEVTAIVAENFTRGDSCVCIMARQAGAWVIPVDMGMRRPLPQYGEFVDGSDKPMLFKAERSAIRYPALDRRLMAGTRNFTKAPAMDRETAVEAVETGIRLVGTLKEKGYQILATGEMGIGNTTTSSAVLSVLLQTEPRLVGGLDLAGLAGVFLGGALYRLPVVVDGLIASAAALAAVKICPAAKNCMLASHVSAEPAGGQVLDALGLRPIIYGNMCLGEGTGAVSLFPLLDMAAAVYDRMSTFSQIQIEEYRPLT